MRDELDRLLGYLDRTLDGERQSETHDIHVRALAWEPVGRLPLVMQYPLPDDCPFRPFPHREAYDDPAKMLFNELVHAFETSIVCHERVGDDLPYTIRANCGTVILASMFGGRIEMPDDNPPWVRPLADPEAIERSLDTNSCDLGSGICPKVVEIYEYYRATLATVPKVERCVTLAMPDLQGPFDTVELLRGSEIFVDLYERPEWVRRFLAKAAEAQVAVARHIQPMLTQTDPDWSCQHAAIMPRQILIRGDSSINVSAQMYREQIADHDELVMRELGGGGVHFCGNGGHLIEPILELPSLRCIDLGQPEMNDLDALYARAHGRRIPLLRVRVPESDLISGRVLDRFPTGVSLFHAASSLDEAARIFSAYVEGARRRATSA